MGGHACHVRVYCCNGTNELESRPIGGLSLQRSATNDAIPATRHTKLSTRLVNDLLTLVINDRAKLGLIAFNPRWIILAFVLNLRSIVAWLILDTRRPTS